jgi:hypothetical protein
MYFSGKRTSLSCGDVLICFNSYSQFCCVCVCVCVQTAIRQLYPAGGQDTAELSAAVESHSVIASGLKQLAAGLQSSIDQMERHLELALTSQKNKAKCEAEKEHSLAEVSHMHALYCSIDCEIIQISIS